MYCHVCNKRLNILQEMTSKCKCNNYFCNKHKFYVNHNCQYDYKLDIIDIPKIQKNKIEKI
uniref:AN1-type domain-containing protein n=1 Tax=viral metagenome TaxID=1070528 RepID=A0A6C0J2H8_9ZZZZ